MFDVCVHDNCGQCSDGVLVIYVLKLTRTTNNSINVLACAMRVIDALKIHRLALLQ